MITPPPMQEAVAAADKQFAVGWKRWFQNIFPTLQAVQNYGVYSLSVPSNSFSLTVPSTAEILQLAPTGILAIGSVTLPSNPQDGQRVSIATTQEITSFILVAAAPIFNPPTTLAAGQTITYYYEKSTNAWYSLTSGSGGGGAGGTPAGASTQVQINYLGSFFASPAFRYDPATTILFAPKFVGSIDTTPIGASVPSTGVFTTLSATSLSATNILFNQDANLHLAQRSMLPRFAPQPQTTPDDSQAVLVGRIFRK